MVDAYAAEHLEIQTRDAAALARRVRNAGAIFVGSFAPVSLGDYCAGSNHVLPTGGCACHSSGLSVRSFRKARARRRVRRAGAARRRPATSSRSPRPRTCPVTAPRSTCACERERPDARLLCARSCGGSSRTARPQLDVPVAAQRQREPLPAERGGRRRRRRGRGATRPRTLNRYPDREFTALREDLAAYLGHGVTPGAGVGRQRLQRGDAADPAGVRRPGPHGGVVRADVLDVSRVRPRHDDRAGSSATARSDFSLDVDHARRGDRGAPAERRAAALAEQPDRHRAAARRPSRACARRPPTSAGRGHRRGLRRVPARRARRARSSCSARHRNLVVSRTMSKAFALAGARLGYLAAAPEICRRAARRPAALPPLRGHPGGRAGRAAARRRAARPGRRPARRARPRPCLAARAGPRRSRTATRTSCCSAGSPTGTRSGRVCSTAAC